MLHASNVNVAEKIPTAGREYHGWQLHVAAENLLLEFPSQLVQWFIVNTAIWLDLYVGNNIICH